MTAQVSFFDPPPVRRPPMRAPATVELRPYQIEACRRIETSLLGARSTLLVMATGTGKTTVFGETLRRTPGRVLVIAHREELIDQAARRITTQTGRKVDIEKAEQVADRDAPVVVASIQTISKQARLERFTPDAFALVIVDEAHHAVSATYQRVLSYFGAAKVLGVTATPDRADELAMGQVFEDVAYCYEIGDAIADGWLCPIRATQVHCDSIDLADVKTVAGDLSPEQLDAVMRTEEVLHQVAKPTLELAGGRRTLVFTTSVENAHRLAEVFNRYREGCAEAVDGGTAREERRRILADHQAGRFQFLCNVGVLTEGYDDPQVSCVAMGRPTKSRALYTQMAGRGTRIAPGKSDLLLLDFVGNSGRHALVSAVDILAGKHPDEVVERARKKVIDQPGLDLSQAMADAQADLLAEAERERLRAEARKAARAKVAYRTQAVDPFKVMGVRNPDEFGAGRFGDGPATEKQVAVLTKLKVPLEGVTKRGASRLIGEAIRRREADLCTFSQAKILQRCGYDTARLPFYTASRLMDALAANRWRPLTPDQESRAVTLPEPGALG